MGWCFLSLHPVPPWSSLLGNCSIHRSCLFNRTLRGSGVGPGPHEDLSKSNTQYQNCLSNLALDQSHWSQRGLFESISRNSVLDRKKVLTQPLNLWGGLTLCQGPPQLWRNGSQEDRLGFLSHEVSRKRDTISPFMVLLEEPEPEWRYRADHGQRWEIPGTENRRSSPLLTYALDSGVFCIKAS